MNKLPATWAWTDLAQVCTSIADGDHQAPPQVPSGIPFLVIGNIRTHQLDFTDCRHVPPEYFESLNSIRRPQKGDVLYSLVGSYGISVLVEDDTPFCVQRHIGILRPSSEISSAFLALALSSRAVFNQATQYATGTAQLTVPLSGLRRIHVPLPPRLEQDRVVAAIDEQFSRLDAGVSALERARQKLTRMHAAVLQAAVTGQLTQANTLATTGVFPGGWEMCTPGAIAANKRNALAIGPFGSNLKVSDYTSQGVPLVFVRQVRSGIFGDADTRFISEEKAEDLRAHRVEGGDVLITKMGEPPGDATVYPASQSEAVITADVIKLSVRDGVLPEYVAMAINSKWVRDQFGAITSGVAQQKVSLARFRQSIRIPLPPTKSKSESLRRSPDGCRRLTRQMSTSKRS